MLKYYFLILYIITAQAIESENLPFQQKKLFHSSWTANIANRKSIDILTYNVWGLPISLYGHDQYRRFACLGDSIYNFDADIVCLQEVFHTDVRHKILNTLQSEYYTYSDYTCNKSIIPGINKDCHGGLMTLSRFPILTEYFFSFPTNANTSTIEKIGAKGLMLSIIDLPSGKIIVANTHLYAGDNNHAENQRLLQVQFIHKKINEILLQYPYPIVFAGDFNIHPPTVDSSSVYQYIQENIQLKDPATCAGSNYFTSDCLNNAYISQNDRPTKLDYIWLDDAANTIFKIKKQGLAFATHPISDHFGWYLTLEPTLQDNKIVAYHHSK